MEIGLSLGTSRISKPGVFTALQDLLDQAHSFDIQPGAPQTALILLTGFGGHEQMLLRHLELTRVRWRLAVLSEDQRSIELLNKALPKNCEIIHQARLVAYPSLRGFQFAAMLVRAWRFVRSLRPLPILVSTGDVGNFSYAQLVVRALTARVFTYVPMAPRSRNRATRIGRFAARRLMTISAVEAGNFNPPADAILKNIAPKHLHKCVVPSSDGRIQIYWVGRLESSQKSPITALELAKQLTKLVSDRFVLNVVGDGPEREQLRDWAARNGIEQQVRFWGWIDFDQQSLDMPKIDILLNTSSFEGVPLTILDAIDLGIPCAVRRGVILDPAVSPHLREWSDVPEAACILAAFIRDKLRRGP